jgi:hypothetical protein
MPLSHESPCRRSPPHCLSERSCTEQVPAFRPRETTVGDTRRVGDKQRLHRAMLIRGIDRPDRKDIAVRGVLIVADMDQPKRPGSKLSPGKYKAEPSTRYRQQSGLQHHIHCECCVLRYGLQVCPVPPWGPYCPWGEEAGTKIRLLYLDFLLSHVFPQLPRPN